MSDEHPVVIQPSKKIRQSSEEQRHSTMPLMSKRQKHILCSNRETLVSNLRLSANFFAPLLAKYILNTDMVETINAEITTGDKNGKFLDILATRDDAAFPTFLDALVKTDQDVLALELDVQMAKRLIEQKRQSTEPEVEIQPRGRGGSIGDIFISYQWDSKHVVHQIYNQLRTSGFSAWLDVNEISNDVTKEISEGLINAAVVLICYSAKYCASYNCRAEANYAFQQKKKIIPIRVETDCEPETWLGLIISGKLRLDFCAADKFDESFNDLLRALAGLGIQKTEER